MWTEHIANKVQPTTAAGPGREIQLAGPRRSVQAAQIVVRGADGVLSDVNMVASDLSDGAGNTIMADHVTFFRQHFIDYTGVSENEPGSEPVPESSPTGDPWVPDPLIPFVDPYGGAPTGAPFGVAQERNQPVWVDVVVPDQAVAGSYSGTITVSAADQADSTVPVSLVVWDFDLPDMTSVTTYFGSHFGQVIDYHADTADCQGSDCWLSWDEHARLIVKRYEQLAHSHRIDTGQFFEPQPESPGNCQPPTDWTAYDAAIQPYMDGSYFADGVPSSWLAAPFSPGTTWGYQADCSEAEYTALAAAWADHLRSQGWLDRAIAYSYDEPPADVFPDIAEHAAWMQNGDADWKDQILVTTAADPESTAVLNAAVGIYCVCLRCYDHWYQGNDTYGRAEWPELFAQGIRLWFYESNAQSDPYPTFASNTLLGAEPQVVMWGAWYEHASGFLLWDTVAYDDEAPWGPNVDWGKSGDGVLIYPGHHNGLAAPIGSPAEVAIDGPVPSYRLKVIRAGLQDWALFKLAEDLGLEQVARQEVARIYGQFGGCDWSGCPPPENGEYYWRAEGALMDEVRSVIAAAIEGASR